MFPIEINCPVIISSMILLCLVRKRGLPTLPKKWRLRPSSGPWLHKTCPRCVALRGSCRGAHTKGSGWLNTQFDKDKNYIFNWNIYILYANLILYCNSNSWRVSWTPAPRIQRHIRAGSVQESSPAKRVMAHGRISSAVHTWGNLLVVWIVSRRKYRHIYIFFFLIHLALGRNFSQFPGLLLLGSGHPVSSATGFGSRSGVGRMASSECIKLFLVILCCSSLANGRKSLTLM